MLHNSQDGLGLRDIRVLRAERTPMRNGKPGIVKVELSSLDDKKFVLRAKTNLRNTIKVQKSVYERSTNPRRAPKIVEFQGYSSRYPGRKPLSNHG